MARRIVLLGPPGAGKGTQARRIAMKHRMPHISTGDIFRHHIHEHTPLGKKIAEFVNNGKLAPDTLTCRIVAERIAEPDCADGYLLDGFPRSLPQATEFDRMLSAQDKTLDLVINLDVPDDEIVERLTNRRVCPKCFKVYNLISQPPKRNNICDESACAGAVLEHREDDREETIRERLRVYYDTTAPALQYYKHEGLLQTVEGAGLGPDAVAERLEEILKKGFA